MKLTYICSSVSRPGLPPSLKGVNLNIMDREKVFSLSSFYNLVICFSNFHVKEHIILFG